MFNLIATMLICLGVANTTPISNYNEKQEKIVLSSPKKANTTTNYTLNIQQSNETTASYENEYFINTMAPTGTQVNLKYNLNGGNQAINVIGNTYLQLPYASLSGNYPRYFNRIGIEEDSSTMIGYMLKITPYRINVETTIKIKTHILVNKFTYNNIEYGINYMYMKKTTYTATDNDLDQYIGQQLKKNQPAEIKNEIEDVNNGFFYSKETDTIDVIQIQNQNINYETQWEDETEITIVPQVNNYLYILYQPEVYSDPNSSQSGRQYLVNGYINITETYPIQITGTNIITDGEYEVIDIPGLMFEVIGMPFAFVSQAFNLTLFPGTPYQINIANLFLSIIAIFVFVWLIMLFIKKGS